MSSLLGIVFMIFVIGCVAALINAGRTAALGMGMMKNVENIRGDAEVEKATPVKAGFGRGLHYELIVMFTDGSQYRTNLGKTRVERKPLSGKYIKISYDEADMLSALREARNEHDRVAAGGQVEGSRKVAQEFSWGIFGALVESLAFVLPFALLILMIAIANSCSGVG